MHKWKCAMCGKTMESQLKHDVRMFCSKQCYGKCMNLRRERDIDVSMPRLTDMHPDGYDALVQGIVRQAREDILRYSPNNSIRQDAEDFLLSEWFERLTNLDGFEILYKLTEIYKERLRQAAKRNSERRIRV